VHALVGENGAGKSTLAKILSGAVRPDSADIYWQGERVSLSSPLDAQRLGIGVIYQELDLFPNLTVAENLVIGNLRVERRQWVRPRDLEEFCCPFLEQVGLADEMRARAGSLPIGKLQLVAVARALSFGARLILMDEPTSSLSDDAVETLFRLIRRLKEQGVSVVYVSHKMDEIYRICDRVTVLRDGATIGTRDIAGTPVDELIAMMVGRELSAASPPPAAAPGEVLLSVSGLSAKGVRGVTFDLRRGEVLGVAGLVGAGRSELGAALFGLNPVATGSIRINGREVRPRSPREALRDGIGLLPEDRKLEGLMMRLSVLENTTLAVLHRFQRFGFTSRRGERAAAEAAHRQTVLKAASWDAPVSSLSGGNQQKVLLAKWLLAGPEALFLDDPARGIDVGAKRDIYEIIAGLAAQGKGVILVSSELPELLRLSDRILVLREGRQCGILDARTATQEQILSLASMPS
jgi:ribose transport system ATP-binding protein